MRKRKLLLVVVILIIAVPLGFIGCSPSQTNTAETEQLKQQQGVEETLPVNSDTPGDSTDLPDSEVDIANFAFSPNEITVPSGTTVIWRNSDSVPHTVTSNDGVFDSGTIVGDGTFSFTFETVGRYPYFCTIHPYMKATIIVE